MSAHTTGWRSPWLEEGLRKGREEGREEGRAEGRAEGREEAMEEARAQFVLEILERRDIAVSAHLRVAITECRDPEVLARWTDRAFSITTVGELFADD